MNKTFKELREIDAMIAELYKKDDKLRNTKFGYAYKRFSEENYDPSVKEFNEKRKDIWLDNALENETTKEVMVDLSNPRGFKFSREGMKRVVEAERKHEDKFNENEIKIMPYYSSYIPELEDWQKEMLAGIVIEEKKKS